MENRIPIRKCFGKNSDFHEKLAGNSFFRQENINRRFVCPNPVYIQAYHETTSITCICIYTSHWICTGMAYNNKEVRISTQLLSRSTSLLSSKSQSNSICICWRAKQQHKTHSRTSRIWIFHHCINGSHKMKSHRIFAVINWNEFGATHILYCTIRCNLDAMCNILALYATIDSKIAVQILSTGLYSAAARHEKMFSFRLLHSQTRISRINIMNFVWSKVIISAI